MGPPTVSLRKCRSSRPKGPNVMPRAWVTKSGRRLAYAPIRANPDVNTLEGQPNVLSVSASHPVGPCTW